MHISVTKDIQDVTASTDHLSKVTTETSKNDQWLCELGFDYFLSILYDSQFMMQDALIKKHKQDPEAQCEENNTSLHDLLSSKN